MERPGGILEAIQEDCNRTQGQTRSYHMESRVFYQVLFLGHFQIARGDLSGQGRILEAIQEDCNC